MTGVASFSGRKPFLTDGPPSIDGTYPVPFLFNVGFIVSAHRLTKIILLTLIATL